MPGAFTHDLVTLVLTPAAFAVSYFAANDPVSAGLAAGAFLFAGLMFGPDLDTVSKQYSRWGPLRVLWFPYRTAFPHRSRWSHGLLFGTLIRVLYVCGIATILNFTGLYLFQSVIGSEGLRLTDILWQGGVLGWFAGAEAAREYAIAAVAGMWAGAASHTLTDITVSFVKTGRTGAFL